MKEATGELSTTVIAIVAIAAIAAVFTAFLLPVMRSQIALTQACQGGPGYKATVNGGSITCTGSAGYQTSGQTWQCTYKDSDGKTYQKTCKN